MRILPESSGPMNQNWEQVWEQWIFPCLLYTSSQRASSVMYADLILVMEDGRLAGAGSHGELLETCSVYREIYESQFESRQEEA